jgi:hypothetical protein
MIEILPWRERLTPSKSAMDGGWSGKSANRPTSDATVVGVPVQPDLSSSCSSASSSRAAISARALAFKHSP